jgi:hypothetical protein
VASFEESAFLEEAGIRLHAEVSEVSESVREHSDWLTAATRDLGSGLVLAKI